MTGEETKQIKKKLRQISLDLVGDNVGQGCTCSNCEANRKKLEDFIQSEIIEPYEKQLEQVEREKITPIKKKAINLELLNSLKDLAEDFTSDFGTMDYEGYGEAVYNEINYWINNPKSQNTQTK